MLLSPRSCPRRGDRCSTVTCPNPSEASDDDRRRRREALDESLCVRLVRHGLGRPGHRGDDRTRRADPQHGGDGRAGHGAGGAGRRYRDVTTRTSARGPIFGLDVPAAVWRPTPDLLADSRLAGLLRTTEDPDLETLQARAVASPAWFWGVAAQDLALDWQRGPDSILDASAGPEWARWWGGGAFNYADAIIGGRAARDPNGEAVAWEGEDGEVRRLSNAQLREAVIAAARMFAAEGVGPGDRVGI